jgi:hypothetical protein
MAIPADPSARAERLEAELDLVWTRSDEISKARNGQRLAAGEQLTEGDVENRFVFRRAKLSYGGGGGPPGGGPPGGGPASSSSTCVTRRPRS